MPGLASLFSRFGRRGPHSSSDREAIDATSALISSAGSAPRYRFAIKAHAERKRAEAARAILASIVESSEDAIIGQTLDGTMLSWNRGAEQIYGYTAAESIGRSTLMLVPPDREAEFWENLERVKRGERVEPYETVRVRKDSARIHLSLTVS